MARFVFDEEVIPEFDSPQEMYTDYKKKKIKGILNYQSELIDNFMETGLKKADVALDLPTGSGKTLVGLLIGEYRRRKDNMKVVYVCPNNQLVNQVVEKANNEYGIEVEGFTGSSNNYNSEKISMYYSGEKIAVTNYSSIFNTNSFFNNADVLIFDDSHSSENYIASNWTLQIGKKENSDLFITLSECLKSVINSTSYKRLTEESVPGTDESWNDLVPLVKQNQIIDELYQVINSKVNDNLLKYPWSNIKDKLNICNIYLSKHEIVIRPYIPPTLKHSVFSNAKQRIYMSATLGNSGELERTVGVSNITRISIEKGSRPSIGRRLFVFPNAKFETDSNFEIFQKIKSNTPRALVLVERNVSARRIESVIKDNEPDIRLFDASQIQDSIEEFENSENAIAVLANRYDGLNLQDDACHLLLMAGLPSTTHLQEKFFINRLSTSILYNERLKTRITQATGRCTRSTNDYAVVMITGRDLENILVSKDKLSLFDPELRAEIEVGFQVSLKAKDIDDLVDIAKLGLTQDEDWDEIENEIIKRKNQYKKNKNQDSAYNELLESAKLEVDYQYHMWMNEFNEAIEVVEKIIDTLKARDLGGYRQYWNYIMASIYDMLYKETNNSVYMDNANRYYDSASNYSGTITWFRNLKRRSDSDSQYYVDDNQLSSILDNIENSVNSIRETRRLATIENEASKIIPLLKGDGLKFEEGMRSLGEFLGYNSFNTKEEGAPDPWWILNNEICIVSENKIYMNTGKKIPIKHVRESAGHPKWINSHINTLQSDTEVINIFVTNSEEIESAAIVHAEGIYYVNRDKLVSFAEKAIAIVSNIKRKFTSHGVLTWRLFAKDELIQGKVTPRDYINFIKSYNLDSINHELD